MITCENTSCIYCFEGDCQRVEDFIDENGICTSAESKKEAAFKQKGSTGNLEDELYAELLEKITSDNPI